MNSDAPAAGRTGGGKPATLDTDVKTLCASNLPENITEREVFFLFGTFPGFASGNIRYNAKSGPIAFISFTTRGEAQAALQGTNGLTIPGDGGASGKSDAPPEIQVSFSYKQSRQVRGDRVVTSNRVAVAGQQPANRHKVGVTGSNSSVDSAGQAADVAAAAVAGGGGASGGVPQPVPNKAALNAGFFPVHSAQYLPGHPPPQLPGHMPLPQQVLPLQLPPQIPQQQQQQQQQPHLMAQAQAQQH
eukprot:Rhum_TRINITY_DN16704_c0_g1::Rhum_TRINITY_DN16704_c0_g1_i1::g.164123::m.164123